VEFKHFEKFHRFGEDEDFVRSVLPPLFQKKFQNLKDRSKKGEMGQLMILTAHLPQNCGCIIAVPYFGTSPSGNAISDNSLFLIV